MTALLFKLAGGVGLFLMGMVLLTDGLKAFAGDALRGWLIRFAGTPAKAFASGAIVTAMLQPLAVCLQCRLSMLDPISLFADSPLSNIRTDPNGNPWRDPERSWIVSAIA